MRVTILLFVALSALSVKSSAQCTISCDNIFHCYKIYCNGYADCGCDVLCRCTAPTEVASYIDSLHPGFFVEQRFGHQIVSAVIPHSPAETAGIVPGDEVVAINRGQPIGCRAATWESIDSSRIARIEIIRAGHKLELSVPLLSLKEILARTSGEQILRTSLQTDVVARSDDTFAPFTFGFRLLRTSNGLEIAAIVPHSPADAAGLQPGDTIIAIDNLKATEMNDRMISSMVSSLDYPVQRRLAILRNSHRSELTLRSEGMSSIVRKAIISDTHTSGNLIAAR